jgi:hypothetical protein
MRRPAAWSLLAAPSFALLLLTQPASVVEGSGPPTPLALPVIATGLPLASAAIPRTLPWEALEFSVRRFLFFSGHLTLRRKTAVFDDDGPLHGCIVDVIETESTASALGRQFGTMRTTSFLDPESGGTLAYHEEKVGERLRRLTFGPDGYRERVYRASPGQEVVPSSSWPLDEDRTHPYRLGDGTAVPLGTVVRDYYNMIADLGRLDFAAAGSTDYFVATKEHVVRFRAEIGERGRRTIEVRDLARDASDEISLPLRRLRLAPVGEDAAEVGGFFAMEGGTEIWLAERTGLLVVIAGELPQVPGRTEILLTAARPASGVTLRKALGR